MKRIFKIGVGPYIDWYDIIEPSSGSLESFEEFPAMPISLWDLKRWPQLKAGLTNKLYARLFECGLQSFEVKVGYLRDVVKRFGFHDFAEQYLRSPRQTASSPT
jgi:hypothetical protein